MGASYAQREKQTRRKKHSSPFHNYFFNARGRTRKWTNRTGTVVVKPGNITRSLSLPTHRTVRVPDQIISADTARPTESKRSTEQFTLHNQNKSMSTQVFDISDSRDHTRTPVPTGRNTDSVPGAIHQDDKQDDSRCGMSTVDHLNKLYANMQAILDIQNGMTKQYQKLTKFMQTMHVRQVKLEASFKELKGIHELQNLLNLSEQKRVEEAEMLADELRSQESSIASSMHAVDDCDYDNDDDSFDNINEEDAPVD